MSATGEKCECATKGSEGRERWGKYPGPWQDEPDRVEFEHMDLPCLLHRGPGGHWCGYVAVPPGHPDHGKHYRDLDVVSVHGGLTYAAACEGHICHVPKPGEPDGVWWFGFDLHHWRDLAPIDKYYEDDYGRKHPHEHNIFSKTHGETYKTVDYARRETEKLAEQLAARR